MKKTVLALTLGLLIGSTGTAIAATSDTVQATFAKFNFLVNGEAKQLATDPLVVDGTSYLPVREVAGLLGYQLDYDAESRTIKLDNGVKPSASSKGVDNVTTVSTEWISLRDLAEKEGLIIAFNRTGFMGIQKGTFKIPIDLDAIAGSLETPDIVKSEFGDIRLFKSEGEIKINSDDWEKVAKSIVN